MLAKFGAQYQLKYSAAAVKLQALIRDVDETSKTLYSEIMRVDMKISLPMIKT